MFNGLEYDETELIFESDISSPQTCINNSHTYYIVFINAHIFSCVDRLPEISSLFIYLFYNYSTVNYVRNINRRCIIYLYIYGPLNITLWRAHRNNDRCRTEAEEWRHHQTIVYTGHYHINARLILYIIFP